MPQSNSVSSSSTSTQSITNISVVDLHSADESFFKVTLKKGQLPDCFAEGTSSMPNQEGGFDILIDDSDPRLFLKAGRTVGSLGLNKVAVKLESDLEFNALTASQFVIGMYSEATERSGLTVAFDLKPTVLDAVRRDVVSVPPAAR